MSGSAVASDDGLEENGSEWQDWNSDEDGGDETGAVSLFDGTRWPDAEAALAHDAAAHGFDLRSFRRDVRRVLLLAAACAHPALRACEQACMRQRCAGGATGLRHHSLRELHPQRSGCAAGPQASAQRSCVRRQCVSPLG